jgi:hypothetical protein
METTIVRKTLRLLPLMLALTACGPDATPAQVTAGWEATGPVRYGMSVDELETATGRELVATEGRDAEACDVVGLQVDGQPLRAMVVGNTVVRVDITESGIETFAGAGVGDSPQYVMARHPGVEATPHRYTDGQYLTVAGPSGSGPEVRMIFETLNGAVTRYRVGRMPEVAWVESCG